MKIARLKGTRRSGSLDPDLMAWVLRALDLIVAVANGSGGPGQKGAGAAAEGAGGVLPWRGFAGNGRSWPSRGQKGRKQGREGTTRYA